MKDDKQENKWFPGVVVGDKVYMAQTKFMEIQITYDRYVTLKSELEQANKEIDRLNQEMDDLKEHIKHRDDIIAKMGGV